MIPEIPETDFEKAEDDDLEEFKESKHMKSNVTVSMAVIYEVEIAMSKFETSNLSDAILWHTKNSD